MKLPYSHVISGMYQTTVVLLLKGDFCPIPIGGVEIIHQCQTLQGSAVCMPVPGGERPCSPKGSWLHPLPSPQPSAPIPALHGQPQGVPSRTWKHGNHLQV